MALCSLTLSSGSISIIITGNGSAILRRCNRYAERGVSNCIRISYRRYDRTKLTLKEIHNTQYVSCMNPTAGSFTIDPRLQRHFAVFAVRWAELEPNFGELFAQSLRRILRIFPFFFSFVVSRQYRPLFVCLVSRKSTRS